MKEERSFQEVFEYWEDISLGLGQVLSAMVNVILAQKCAARSPTV